MIRINLLGTAKAKKGRGGRRFAMPKMTTDGPSPLFLAAALVVVFGAGLFLYHGKLQRRHVQLKKEITENTLRIASLQKVKQAYLQRQKDYDAFKKRFDVIDELRASQVGPVPLLSAISETVNASDGVWLLTMRDEGAKVSLEGIALGPVQVAKLMTNLKKSGYFTNVELKDTVQKGDSTIETFSFHLVCEKTNTKA
jgi:Tfp pilus assembly protein PilN